MFIITILCIEKYTLAVFCTSVSSAYKYNIIDEYGTVYPSDNIFNTAQAAENEARRIIDMVYNWNASVCLFNSPSPVYSSLILF